MKQINGPLDLAINGAPPAFEHPLHVGRPNMGSREAFLDYTKDIFDRRWFTNNGPLVQEFEKRIADYLGVKHCISMCNGTVALEIAIRALGLEGEVIVPSYTFIATAHALYWQGITPVFADIDSATHNLEPSAVRQMITPRTTGIIGVHLWGRTAPVEDLQALADEHNLKLMFDAAHAFSCSYKGKMIGNFGACEVFSFHATKFFNTFEGGAIVTNDDTLATSACFMRNFGFMGYDNVVHPGTNGKMIEVAAAMGLVNLGIIDSVIETNHRNYIRYQSNFKNMHGVSLLPYDQSEQNNFQYLVIQIDDQCTVTRDYIVQALHAENILARKYFWPGSHNMKPYCDLFPHAGLCLSNTIDVSAKTIVLPTGTTVDPADIDAITAILAVICERRD